MDGRSRNGSGIAGAKTGATPARANTAVGIAATLALAAGLAFAWFQFGAPMFAKATVYTTATGEKRDVYLPDSSLLIIGPLSEVTVSGQYGRRERRVDVVGQAWFNVRRDSTKPFRVYATGTITEDIGTSFSVRAVPVDSVVTVIVVQGSARVGLLGAATDQSALLNENDAVDIDAKKSTAHILRNVAAGQLTSWHTGRLEFDNAALSAVAPELKRWYGLTMVFGKPDLADRHVSYSMPTGDRDEALNVLRRSLLLKIEVTGDTVIVR